MNLHNVSSTSQQTDRPFRFSLTLMLLVVLLQAGGCATPPVTKTLETTAYCGCGSCCSWERGSWRWLKLDFWNRYVNGGPRSGAPYYGLTASGTVPYEPRPGLFSSDSLMHPWMIPVRVVFFPWYFLPKTGTIAADTDYYPFGTRMHVPGYGWGVVEDRGGAIKGPTRIDLYFDSHAKALQWGRKTLNVTVEYPSSR
ncbi:MAG: 3D domain-containing protein [Desulforhopalus sp.]